MGKIRDDIIDNRVYALLSMMTLTVTPPTSSAFPRLSCFPWPTSSSYMSTSSERRKGERIRWENISRQVSFRPGCSLSRLPFSILGCGVCGEEVGGKGGEEIDESVSEWSECIMCVRWSLSCVSPLEVVPRTLIIRCLTNIVQSISVRRKGSG